MAFGKWGCSGPLSHPNLINPEKEKRHDTADGDQTPGRFFPQRKRKKSEVAYQETRSVPAGHGQSDFVALCTAPAQPCQSTLHLPGVTKGDRGLLNPLAVGQGFLELADRYQQGFPHIATRVVDQPRDYSCTDHTRQEGVTRVGCASAHEGVKGSSPKTSMGRFSTAGSCVTGISEASQLEGAVTGFQSSEHAIRSHRNSLHLIGRQQLPHLIEGRFLRQVIPQTPGVSCHPPPQLFLVALGKPGAALYAATVVAILEQCNLGHVHPVA